MTIPARVKRAAVFCLAAALCMLSFGTSIEALEAEPPANINDTLIVITKEEKETLQKLFTLTQEIEVAEQEEKRLEEETKTLQEEIKTLEAAIVKEEKRFTKKKEGLKQVLKSYQRMGSGSYLEIIMDSESLRDFLRRINTLRDITRNTGDLLQELEESKRTMAAEKDRLNGRLALAEEKQRQSREALAEKLELRAGLEKSLTALKDKRAYFEEQLAGMKKLLDELKPILAQALKEFSNIIEEGSMPRDALKISYSLFGVRASIEQEDFNAILDSQPSLSEMEFAFHEDKTEISMPERSLVFTGNFVAVDEHTLKFRIDGGSFYGMPLEQEFIEEMLREGELKLDFEPLLGRSTIQYIKTYEGYLEISIKPNLF
ncbi:MAG: hypothetical protein K0R84_505 [Clostridia bacterium]|nr:hypothetical protein [Clostridia bacterium]